MSEDCPPREPLLQSALPNYPWERVASDLFELNGKTYVLVVDYYSRYIEVMQLKATNAVDVIAALKSIFSRHGIPAVLMSDNEPQYGSGAMEDFAKTYKFTSQAVQAIHKPTERAVKTAKRFFEHSRPVPSPPELPSYPIPMVWT